MIRVLKILPIVCASAFITVGEICAFPPGLMAALGLAMAAGLLLLLLMLRRRGGASMIEWGMSSYVALAGAGFLLWPGGAGRAVAAAPVAVLYGVMFCAVALPPLLGGPLFTEFFAKKTTPEAVWQTDIFRNINRNMTAVWALLFAAAALSAALAALLPALHGPAARAVFTGAIPLALMLGVGLPFTKKYPAYYQAKMGLEPLTGGTTSAPAAPAPVPTPATASAPRPVREEKMSGQSKIVAINGSPHGGIGNTAQMIEMLRPTLESEGLALEVITLHDKEIDYCTGCAVCLEKGKCWIPDEHRGLVKRLLEADGIILASPVYFLHVTAQMKTFLDRSLGWGHKPRDTYKPGLAISVAAAFQEREVADYLADMLHVYGAFSVGTLTALATGPGGFLGRETVQARAQDLARDLANAVKQKRRYPVTSRDLFFYLHMGWLVSANKDGVMKDDYRHWEEKGFFQGFEKYVNQSWAPTPELGGEAREAWVRQMIDERKRKKMMKAEPDTAEQARMASPHPSDLPQSCQELIKDMPLAFRPDQARGVDAVIQFQVSGSENFDAYLTIAEGKCAYHQGKADNPSVTIETPAQVWLDIAYGRQDGQIAFMQGLYKVQGDITLLMRLGSMFSRLG